MVSSAPKKIIILIHGIRTRADWQKKIVSKLENDETIVISLKYGYFNSFKFWIPISYFRDEPLNYIEKQLDSIFSRYFGNDFYIFAHSFGTYAISKIIMNNPHYRIHKLVLCGSVISNKFEWPRIANQITGNTERFDIINECGVRDIWPVLASTTTFGYGSSGTDGFGSVSIRDRFHNIGHSGFFSDIYIDKYLVPLLSEDKFFATEVDQQGTGSPFWMALCRIPFILFLFLAFALVYIAFNYGIYQFKQNTLPNSLRVERFSSNLENTEASWLRAKIERNITEELYESKISVTSENTSIDNNLGQHDSIRGHFIFQNKEFNKLGIVSIHFQYVSKGKVASSAIIEGEFQDLERVYKSIPAAALYGLRSAATPLLTLESQFRITYSLLAYAFWHEARRVAKMQQYDQAEELLQRAIKLDKKFATAYFSLSQVFLEKNDTSSSKTLLDQATTIDPDFIKIDFIVDKSNPIPNLKRLISASQWINYKSGLMRKSISDNDYGLIIHTLKASKKDFQISVSLSSETKGSDISTIRRSLNATAAINGGFFDLDSQNRLTPSGLLIIDGRILNPIKTGSGTGILSIGKDFSNIENSTSMLDYSNIYYAIQSGPRLIEKNGKIGIYRDDYIKSNRSAICINDNSYIFLSAKGRGLSLFELATILHSTEVEGGFGCKAALNLDGGPSSQLSFSTDTEEVDDPGLWKINTAVLIKPYP